MNVSDELTLRDLFGILRRHRRKIFFYWIIVFIGVAIYTAFLTPQYRATVVLRVQAPDDSSTHAIDLLNPFNTASGFKLEEMISIEKLQECLTQLGVIRPGMTEHQVAEATGEFEKRVSVSGGGADTQLATISVISNNGHKVALEANTLANVAVKRVAESLAAKNHQSKLFVEQQLKEVEVRLRDSEDRLRKMQEKFGPQSQGSMILGRLIELKNKRTELSQKFTPSYPEIKQINGEIQSIDAQLKKLPNQDIDLTRVSRDIHLNEELYTDLMKHLQDARIMESARLDPITILEPAIEPLRPEKPNKPFNLAAGAMLGLLVACAIIWVRHQLDTSLLTQEDIENTLKLPVLALVPHIERRSNTEKKLVGEKHVERKLDRLGQLRSRMIVYYPPKSPCVEVYHILRTNLPKLDTNGRGQILMFTSAVVSEGKSITSANFAIAAAQAGIPTLLVEMDLRKPSVHRLFGLPQEPGLADYFYLSPRWENYLKKWDMNTPGSTPPLSGAINTSGIANLRILTAGKTLANPVLLLSSERLVQLLDDMRRRFPIVVVDCAPVMLFADCSMIAAHADGVILVYRYGRTGRESIRQAHNHLVGSKAKVLGVVVNDMMRGETADYTPYYSSYADSSTESAA